MAQTLDITTFTRIPSPSDRYINIYDISGAVVMQIDPYSSTFQQKGYNVYILTDSLFNYNNVLRFSSVSDAESAVTILNDIKKSFIDILNTDVNKSNTYIPLAGSDKILGDLIPSLSDLNIGNSSNTWGTLFTDTISMNNAIITESQGKLKINDIELIDVLYFSTYTASTNILDDDTYDALVNNNANLNNPFVTLDDISMFSGDTKLLLVSPDDENEGYLYEKLKTDNNIISLIVTGDTNKYLNIDIDLSSYYTKTESDNNYLQYNTSIHDLSGYTSNEIDTLLNNINNELHTHTGDTSLHFTKHDIHITDLNDTNISNPINGNTLFYQNGKWINSNINLDSRYYTKSETYNTGQTFNKTEITTLLSNKTNNVNFVSHTAATNPHHTSFYDLIDTYHTHTQYSPTSHTHNNLYFTKQELLDTSDPNTNGGILDNRYFTQEWIKHDYYDKSRVFTKAETLQLIEEIVFSGDTADIYYNKYEVDELLLNYSETSHTHDIHEIENIEYFDTKYLILTGGTVNDLKIQTLSGEGITSISTDNNGNIINGNIKQFSVNKNTDSVVDVIDKFSNNSVSWFYTVSNNSNIRTGIIYSCWLADALLSEYSSNTTIDIGDTSDIQLNVDINDTYIRLWVNCTSEWNIKLMRMFI